MKYLNSSFSVFAPGSDDYRSNWDRIFGDSKNKVVILLRAVDMRSREWRTVFRPEDFEDLCSRSDAEIALFSLAAEGKFVAEHSLYCENGHCIRVSTELLTRLEQCPDCAAWADPNYDLSYTLKTQFVLR